MPGKRLCLVGLAALLLAGAGCCRWCDRWCPQHTAAPAAYAPQPCVPCAPVCCPTPAPVCCPTGSAPVPVAVPAGGGQWQRQYCP